MRFTAWILVASAVLLQGRLSLAAYAFVNLIDNTGPFASFGAPSINAAGQVAFRAELDTNFSGIYAAEEIAGQGISITTIAHNNGTAFQSFIGQTPAIRSGRLVTFVANRTGAAGGGNGLFEGSTSAVTTLAVSSSGVGVTTFGRPSVNAHGQFAFRGFHVEVPAGQIETGVFSGLTPLVSSSGPFQNFGNGNAEIALNDSGAIAFSGALDAGSSGIYTVGGSASGAVVVADTSGPFSSFTHSSPAINSGGTVAFFAQLKAGGEGIFTGPSDGTSAATPYADTVGPYSSFSPVAAINAAGAVLFAARLDGVAQGNGLFTGPDPAAHRVVKTGDPLFGSTARDHVISNASINDAGQVAFTYTLADGRAGIAIAKPLVTESADFDLDSDVDGADFLVWQRHVGTVATGTRATGDANADMIVDYADLSIWTSQFGGPPAWTVVAEPATVSMAMLAAPAVISQARVIFRRRRLALRVPPRC